MDFISDEFLLARTRKPLEARIRENDKFQQRMKSLHEASKAFSKGSGLSKKCWKLYDTLENEWTKYNIRKRVAAYVRVSTDGEKQLQSFQSQKEYYQDKIYKNKEWVMVGIYADEAITETKTVKRDGFLKMINDCMAGMVDVILTKSISRFSCNLVDTLQYDRMLKDKGIAVIFEMKISTRFPWKVRWRWHCFLPLLRMRWNHYLPM